MKPTLFVSLEKIYPKASLPKRSQLVSWLYRSLYNLAEYPSFSEIHTHIRITSSEESQDLNYRFRGKKKPTNVLTFVYSSPQDLINWSDIIICDDVVREEAHSMKKKVMHHYAHLCIHGFLHSLGYRHDEAHEAEEMEALEKTIMQICSYPNPYEENIL